MNYGATLAVMVTLAFCFPIALRGAISLGVPAALASTVLWTGVIFAFAAYIVRWQVGRHSATMDRITRAKKQVAADPENPTSYYVDGEHIALLLLGLDRRREAAELIDRYACLGGAKEADIVMLREAQSIAEVRKKHGAHSLDEDSS